MNDPREPSGADTGPDFRLDAGEVAHATPLDDLEQIRWALSLTPDERLAALQDFVDTFWTPAHG